MLFVAKQQLPTPAALSELDCTATKPEPHGQDLIRFHSGNTSRTCFEMLQPQPQQMKPVDDPSPTQLHRHGLASIAVPQNCCKGFPHRPLSISRSEISIGSNAGITSTEISPKQMEHEINRDYSNEPPLSLSERVSTYSARRASMREWLNSRFFAND